MCDCSARIDPIVCESRPRRVSVNGVKIKVCLENYFWDELADIAMDCGHSTDSLIARLHERLSTHDGERPELTSFLRVVCLTHLRRSTAGLIGLRPADR